MVFTKFISRNNTKSEIQLVSLSKVYVIYYIRQKPEWLRSIYLTKQC